MTGGTNGRRLSFGIKTTPAHTDYADVLRVWREADGIERIEHAWLWDHLPPLFGPPTGPTWEGWTTLAALAATTERIGLGLLVSNNRLRPPALLAKTAATVEGISEGRLTVGLGMGPTLPRPGQPAAAGPAARAVAGYRALGIEPPTPGVGLARLAESCRVLRALWENEEPTDFAGRHYRLAGARAAPRPARRLPLLIGGSGDGLLRVAAEHADLWNISGPPHADVARVRERAAALDAACAQLGRDPGEITRSVQTHVSYTDPAATRAVVTDLLTTGATHIVLSLPAPFPEGVARWVTDEIIVPVLEGANAARGGGGANAVREGGGANAPRGVGR
ncbi:LLM class flavin-dependent oxidoreductase [Streptomyces sp. 3MP-14]|uniref:LLM class flavin-dependent oxidoreductase n=1 Tax=Streptomyces mimosae TaxID=2586635 RepID=A0A5N6A1U5_9ACTN|nr:MULTISPECIES: LLM class flavin-dependent oxidoreductase [Streptomyces]KAB8162631.1 LLM class flavin-dependent oxidoreductase [Streptomyces mimosae]KAB8174458.1 LLM class flavin-dependent oxidoreductase [Streptomyces sp. 3MP-14]